jgi:hypothetical protein
MILLVQGFGQSHLLLDIQVTTFHILLNCHFEKEDLKSFYALVDDTIIYEMVICCCIL